jgi:hypothetical protein
MHCIYHRSRNRGMISARLSRPSAPWGARLGFIDVGLSAVEHGARRQKDHARVGAVGFWPAQAAQTPVAICSSGEPKGSAKGPIRIDNQAAQRRLSRFVCNRADRAHSK